VVWSSSGQIVTNAHVVEGTATAEVELWDGGRFAARIGKRDRRRDLALLELDASGLPAAASGDSNALRVGELVIAVGNPMGFIGAASTGVVHRIEYRSWVVSRLRLAPGNSGGPLANARGDVVGINTMIAGGLAFAIPSKSVAQFLRAPLDDSGLGVVVRPILVRPILAGLIVLEVIPHSAADRASLLQAIFWWARSGSVPIDRRPWQRDSHQPRGHSRTSIPPRRERERPHGSGSNGGCFSESGVIRVLVASRSSELEHAIRSSPSVEFVGRVDPSHLLSSELSGDVLLIEVEDPSEHDWRALAELPIPILLLMTRQALG